MNDLSEILKKEKFNEKEINWKQARWGDVDVNYTEDKDSWYYLYGKTIYTQAKQGDHTPHCYECGSEIEFGERKNSVHLKEFGDGLVGSGKVRISHIPYCPKCESKPSEIGFIDE